MKPSSSAAHWTDNWFDEDYLLLYKHRNRADATEQLDLFVECLSPKKDSKILDAGCGYGRHAEILQQRGFEVEGVDKSKVLVEYGKRLSPGLRIVHDDIRSFGKKNPERFDVVLSLFTSFGYHNLRDNFSILRALHNVLKRGGFLWLDFLNADAIKTMPLMDTFTQISKSKVIVQKRRIEKNRIVKYILIMERGKADKERFESVHLYSKEDLLALLREVGFKVLKVFGDYRGSKWSPTSPRTIVVGRRGMVD